MLRRAFYFPFFYLRAETKEPRALRIGSWWHLIAYGVRLNPAFPIRIHPIDAVRREFLDSARSIAAHRGDLLAVPAPRRLAGAPAEGFSGSRRRIRAHHVRRAKLKVGGRGSAASQTSWVRPQRILRTRSAGMDAAGAARMCDDLSPAHRAAFLESGLVIWIGRQAERRGEKASGECRCLPSPRRPIYREVS